MKVWLTEILVVLAYSPRSQFAIVLGLVSFAGFMLAGEYFVDDVDYEKIRAQLVDNR